MFANTFLDDEAVVRRSSDRIVADSVEAVMQYNHDADPQVVMISAILIRNDIKTREPLLNESIRSRG